MKVEIRIKGNLSDSWDGWFDDLRIIREPGNTLLRGFVKDESAFYGILNQIRDLRLKLISAHIIDE